MTLEARNLTLALDGAPVVRDVSLRLAPGEITALVGPNGAGKSTLMRALAGLLTPAEGAVTLDGEALASLPPAHRARRIAWLPQEARAHWPVTVRRLVALGRLPHLDAFHRPRGADLAAIDRALEQTDILRFAERPIGHLSAGERARAFLARALATDAPVLLTDEPVAALDPDHQFRVMELLAAQAADGRAVMVVLHDLTLAVRFCPRIVMLHRGRLLADGAPDDVLTDARLAESYGIRVDRLGGLPVPVGRV